MPSIEKYNFLFTVMKKFGFAEKFILWANVLQAWTRMSHLPFLVHYNDRSIWANIIFNQAGGILHGYHKSSESNTHEPWSICRLTHSIWEEFQTFYGWNLEHTNTHPGKNFPNPVILSTTEMDSIPVTGNFDFHKSSQKLWLDPYLRKKSKRKYPIGESGFFTSREG